MNETPERPPITSVAGEGADGTVEKLDGLRVANGRLGRRRHHRNISPTAAAPGSDRFTFDPPPARWAITRLATLDGAPARPDGGCCDVIGHY